MGVCFCRSIVDNNFPGFNEKMNCALDRIYMFMGLPAATTFYKKILLKKSKMLMGS